LLPYVEEEKLYQDFHLHESWDSPHNKELLPRMPKIYEPPARAETGSPPNASYYQVFVGEGAAFESTKPLSLTDFTDRSLTCLVVEAAQPVAWSQPADLSYADDQPLPELGGIFRGGSRFSGLAKQDGFNAAFADGSVRWIKRLRSEEDQSQFRSLILRKGNKTEPELLR
jgi:prepilin-type processing-associated H-X9-DG protein